MDRDMTLEITGRSAADIADSVRALIERGALQPGEALPPVRTWRTPSASTATPPSRRTGSSPGRRRRHPRPRRHARRRPLRRRPGGVRRRQRAPRRRHRQPRPRPHPRPVRARSRWPTARPVRRAGHRPRPGAVGAQAWMAADLAPSELRLTITSGAADAVERLLAQALVRDDAVALEDPCFLTSIHTVRVGGYRPVPVPVDDEGMTVEGLRSALDQGVRAIVCTPRAQNPDRREPDRGRAPRSCAPCCVPIRTCSSSRTTTSRCSRAAVPLPHRAGAPALGARPVGVEVPRPRHVPRGDGIRSRHRRAARDAAHPGTTWVSHLLQRLALALVTDPDEVAAIEAAGAHYAARNARSPRG